jgi:hypothetical protein
VDGDRQRRQAVGTGSGVGTASAQATARPAASVDVVDVVYDVGGGVESYGVALSTSGVTSACSSGGTPLPPRTVFGYLADEEVNVVPLDPSQYTESVIDPPGDLPPYTVRQTEVSTRAVADAYLPFNANGIGRLRVRAFIDVFGRCQFGSTVVESTRPMYVPASSAATVPADKFVEVAVGEVTNCFIGTPPLTLPCSLSFNPGGFRAR